MNRAIVWMAACSVAAVGAPFQAAVGAGDGVAVIINEVDADTPSTDVAEFIELYDGGIGETALDGLVIVLFNGNGDASYNAFDLDTFATDAAGYFVAGNAAVPGVDLVIPDGSLQNGADAIALYFGNAEDFPPGTPVTTTNLIDALVYDTNDGDDAGLLVLLNPGQPQVNEGGAGNSSRDSNQRCPNGSGGWRNTDTYEQWPPTPDGENFCPTTGACCNRITFICMDDVDEADCLNEGDEWTPGVACADLDPPCAPLTGACCNRITFVCMDDVEEADCLNEGDEWTPGVACADLDPPCAPDPTGACCDDGSGLCLDGVTEADCAAQGRRWGGADSTCQDIDPPCEGATPGNVLISEIVDGTLPGGQPKWVEVTNCDEVPVSLDLYSIGNYNNGGTTLGGGQSTRLSGTLMPGESYVFSFEDVDNTACDPDGILNCFEFTYAEPADQYTGPFINGNDVVALFLGLATGDGSDAILVDVYGVIGVDGVGTVWEYTDSYSNRLPGASATDTFDPDEWFFAGPDALQTGNDDEELELLRTLTFPGEHDCVAAECREDLDDSGAVDFGDILAVLAAWGPYEPCPPFVPEDLNENCDVDFADILEILAVWGPCP